MDDSGYDTTDYRKTCKTCKLYVKDKQFRRFKADWCKYHKQYLNGDRTCKYHTDKKGPYIDFKKKFKKSEEVDTDNKLATFE